MKKLRIHCILHEAHEGMGSITRWIQKKNHSLTLSCLYEGDPLPLPENFDWLIVMGGSMSVNDEAQYVWLRHEKILIRKAIESGKKVLGICLGAQLIASALHTRVGRNPVPEIGWFPVHFFAHASNPVCTQRGSGAFYTFQWHGETFELPEGAELLAQSILCKNQAFSLGNKVLALQFHPEMTAEAVESMLQSDPDELPATTGIQTKQEILAGIKTHLQANQVLMYELLDFLAESE